MVRTRRSVSVIQFLCERHVNLLVYSLSLHRHSYIGFILDFASSIHNKQQLASSSTINPVYVSRVDSSALVFPQFGTGSHVYMGLRCGRGDQTVWSERWSLEPFSMLLRPFAPLIWRDCNHCHVVRRRSFHLCQYILQGTHSSLAKLQDRRETNVQIAPEGIGGGGQEKKDFELERYRHRRSREKVISNSHQCIYFSDDNSEFHISQIWTSPTEYLLLGFTST